MMSDIKSLEDGIIVNFTATVTSIKPATAVSTRVLQQVSVSDETASITLSAWEPFVGQFELSQTYSFSGVRIRSYRKEKVLSLSSQSSFEPTSSKQVLKQEDNDAECLLKNPTIIGLANLTIHHSWKKCKGKITMRNTKLWICSTCNMVQIVENMPMGIAANLMFESTTGQVYDLKACTEVLQTILSSASMAAMTEEGMEEVILQKREEVSSVSYYKQSTYVNRIVMQ